MKFVCKLMVLRLILRCRNVKLLLITIILSLRNRNGGVAMDVRFLTRNVELTGDVKEYMEKKVGKLEKFFDKIHGTQIALNFKRGMNVVEITSNVNGVVMRGEDYAPDLRQAFDKALKNIERQIKKHKDYLTEKVRMKVHDISFDIDPELFSLTDDEENAEKDIVKTKKFNVGVMTAKEATMQMDLLGHNFFIFKNDITGDINVVYRRDSGGYGLLEPK